MDFAYYSNLKYQFRITRAVSRNVSSEEPEAGFWHENMGCQNCFSVLVQSIKNNFIFSEYYYWFMKQQMSLPVCLCMHACINGILRSPSFTTAPKGKGRQLFKVTEESEKRNENQKRGKWWQSNVLVLCLREQQQTQLLRSSYSILLQWYKVMTAYFDRLAVTYTAKDRNKLVRNFVSVASHPSQKCIYNNASDFAGHLFPALYFL